MQCILSASFSPKPLLLGGACRESQKRNAVLITTYRRCQGKVGGNCKGRKGNSSANGSKVVGGVPVSWSVTRPSTTVRPRERAEESRWSCVWARADNATPEILWTSVGNAISRILNC
ncbi:hypothetical protein TRVL_08536 [Trypanosoma vivax]|nr:hypothetical protein TRVL_08536 [Trypanosoma vivax]